MDLNPKKIWGVKCEISSCGKTKRNFPSLKFFRFPKKHEEILRKWISICKIPNGVDVTNRYVCSDHFYSNDIGQKRLKKNSVPSLNIDTGNEKIEDEHIPVVFESKCYSARRSFQDELEFHELPQLEPRYVRLESEEKFPDTFCRNCSKFQKNCEFYRQKYTELLKKIKKIKNTSREKKTEKRKLSYRLKRQQNQKEIFKKKARIPCHQVIENLPNITTNSKVLCKMLLKKKSRKTRWSEKEKNLAFTVHYKSPSTYNYLRDFMGLNLPCSSSISRWQPIKYITPGFNEQIFDKLKLIALNLSTDHKLASLVWDEIYIKKELVYDQHRDEIVGFGDDGNTKVKLPGRYVCVFMIRALFASWKYIVSYYATDKPISADVLTELVKKNIDYCHQIGFSIKNVTCDQGSSNRSCFKKLGVIADKYYFLHNSSKIFACYDFPHLMKSARNLLLKHNINCKDGIVSWKCVEELYLAEKNKSTKMCPKLTSKHVWPNTWQKMKVSYAANVFSHTVKSAILTAHDLNIFSEDVSSTAISTAKFFEVMNNVFDCMNSKKPFDKSVYKSPLKKEGTVRNYLEDIIPYFETISFESDKKSYWVKGIIQTIRSSLDLSQNLLNEYHNKQFFLTYKLNQDPLENLFSLIRSHGGFNCNPSLYSFNQIIAKIVSHRISTFMSNKSNCQNDNEDFSFELEHKAYNNDPVFVCKDVNRKIVCDDSEYSEKPEENEGEFFSYDIIEDFLIEETALRYFVGYIAYKMLKKINCELCENILIRKIEVVTLQQNTEMFLFHKNYCSR